MRTGLGSDLGTHVDKQVIKAGPGVQGTEKTTPCLVSEQSQHRARARLTGCHVP